MKKKILILFKYPWHWNKFLINKLSKFYEVEYLYIKELRPYKVNFSIQKNINFSNIDKIANNLARPFKNFKVLKF